MGVRNVLLVLVQHMPGEENLIKYNTFISRKDYSVMLSLQALRLVVLRFLSISRNFFLNFFFPQWQMYWSEFLHNNLGNHTSAIFCSQIYIYVYMES